jgi:hypothetical protein
MCRICISRESLYLLMLGIQEWWTLEREDVWTEGGWLSLLTNPIKVCRGEFNYYIQPSGLRETRKRIFLLGGSPGKAPTCTFVSFFPLPEYIFRPLGLDLILIALLPPFFIEQSGSRSNCHFSY